MEFEIRVRPDRESAAESAHLERRGDRRALRGRVDFVLPIAGRFVVMRFAADFFAFRNLLGGWLPARAIASSFGPIERWRSQNFDSGRAIRGQPSISHFGIAWRPALQIFSSSSLIPGSTSKFVHSFPRRLPPSPQPDGSGVITDSGLPRSIWMLQNPLIATVSRPQLMPPSENVHFPISPLSY
jgi:hypothetical protein